MWCIVPCSGFYTHALNTLILSPGSLTFWQAHLIAVPANSVNHNFAFLPCVPLFSAHLHYGNLNKGYSIYPYPFSLTKPITIPFPICADTFRKANNFLPRCSLGNQLVCPNLLKSPGRCLPLEDICTLKFSTVSKGKRTITVMQLLLAEPQSTKSFTFTSQIWSSFSNSFCTQGISLKSWTEILTNRP